MTVEQYKSGMYLGVTDNGIRVDTSGFGRPGSTGDEWDNIKDNPNYWEWEQFWTIDKGHTGWPNAERHKCVELLYPAMIQGVEYKYCYLNPDGRIYFSNTDDMPVPNYLNDPGWEDGVFIQILHGVANLICSFGGSRTTSKCQTLRVQGGSFDNGLSLQAKASVIWEITFYKRDPEIDDEQTFCDIKVSQWDYLADFQLGFEGVNDWWNTICMQYADKSIPFTTAIGPAITYEKNKLEGGNADKYTPPRSFFITSNLQGYNFQCNADYYVQTDGDYYDKRQTIGSTHSCSSRDIEQISVIASVHSINKKKGELIRNFTDVRDDYSDDPDNLNERIDPKLIGGMYPSWFLANTAHDYEGGMIWNHCIGAGTTPFWKPCYDEYGVDLPRSGILEFTDGTPGADNYYGYQPLWGSFSGAQPDRPPLTARLSLGKEHLPWTGRVRFTASFGYPYPREQFIDLVTIYTVIHGTDPVIEAGAEHGYITDGCKTNQKDKVDLGITSYGVPYKRSIGKFHSLIAFGDRRDPDFQENHGMYIDPNDYDEAKYLIDVGYEKDPETGAYLSNYSTYEQHAKQEVDNYPAYYMQPFRHGKGRKPSWGIIGNHSKSYVDRANFMVVYFDEQFALDGIGYRPDTPEWDELREERPSRIYMTTDAYALNNYDDNYDDETNHKHYHNPQTLCKWVDEDAIYLEMMHWINGFDATYTQYAQFRGMANSNDMSAGHTSMLFFDDPDSCVTRYVDIIDAPLGTPIKVDFGWKPDLVWIWPCGACGGHDYNPKFILRSMVDGDPLKPYDNAVRWDSNGDRRSNDPADYYYLDDGYIQGARWDYKLTHSGLMFRRSREWDQTNREDRIDPDTGLGLKMFICAMRTPKPARHECGQFFLNGRADLDPEFVGYAGGIETQAWFTYSKTAVPCGDYATTGHEAGLEITTYPPLMLERGELELTGGEVEFVYVRKLIWDVEAAEFELEGYGPGPIRVIPPMVVEGAGDYALEGFDAELGRVGPQILLSKVGIFDLVTDPAWTQFGYYKYYRIKADETGAFISTGLEVGQRRHLIFKVGEAGVFELEGEASEPNEMGRVWKVSAGKVRYWGSNTGPAREPRFWQLEGGSFEITGQEVGRIIGNSQVGEFALTGLEAGMEVTTYPPLKCSMGLVELRTEESEGVVTVPEYPVRGMAWHSNYTSTGEEIRIDSVPFTPALIHSIPAKFPESIRLIKDIENVETLKVSDLWGDRRAWMGQGMAYDKDNLTAGFGDWIASRIAGQFWPSSNTECRPKWGQPSMIKGFLENGVIIGDGKVTLDDYLGEDGYSPDYPEDVPQDYNNGAYNFITGDNPFQVPNEEDQNFALEYCLMFLEIVHPELTGDSIQEMISGDKYPSTTSYNSFLPAATALPDHVVGEWGRTKSSIPTIEYFYRGLDAPKYYYLDEIEWKTGTMDELNEYLTDYAYSVTPAGDAWAGTAPRTHSYPHDRGYYWVLKDQKHGGIAMGGVCSDNVEYYCMTPKGYRAGDNYFEQFHKMYGVYNVPHGFDTPPELLIIMPGRYMENKNLLFYEEMRRQLGTSSWYKPEWKGEAVAKGVRPTDTYAPSFLIDSINYLEGEKQLDVASFDNEDLNPWSPEYTINWYDNPGDHDKRSYSATSFNNQYHAMPLFDFYGNKEFRLCKNHEEDFRPYTHCGVGWYQYNTDTGMYQFDFKGPEVAQPDLTFIALQSKAGYTKVGTYSADGSDTIFVPCTFRPGIVWIKATGPTDAEASALFIHIRPINPLVDGLSHYTEMRGYPQAVEMIENMGPTDAWGQQDSGVESVIFQEHGFLVQAGRLGNNPDMPGQEVTFVAFSAEHGKISTLNGEIAHFELQGQEIGGHKPDTVNPSGAGSFFAYGQNAYFKIHPVNANSRKLRAEAGGFTVRGIAAWEPEAILPANNPGEFVTEGQEIGYAMPDKVWKLQGAEFHSTGWFADFHVPFMRLETGEFRSTLMWAGGQGNSCNRQGDGELTPEGLAVPKQPRAATELKDGSVACEMGNEPSFVDDRQRFYDEDWDLWNTWYKDDQYESIQIPQPRAGDGEYGGYQLKVNGTSYPRRGDYYTQRFWLNSNCQLLFESGSSTYNCSGSKPSQDKFNFMCGDRCQYHLWTKEFDDRFVIRTEHGTSYSDTDPQMVFELTIFYGIHNVFQVNVGEMALTSGSHFGMCDSSSYISDLVSRCEPNTTYVFVTEDEGMTYQKHQGMHFGGGIKPKAVYCMFPVTGEFESGGGDPNLWKNLLSMSAATGSFAVRGRIP